MPQHSFITIAIPYPSERRAKVERELDALKSPNRENDVLDRIDILHFISGSIIPGAAGETDHLLFEFTSDGTEDEALALFDGPLGLLLRPAIDAADPYLRLPLSQALKPIRTGHSLFDVPGLNFIGTPGMTAKRIRRERDFARKLRDHFDRHPPLGEPLAIVEGLRHHIRTHPDFAGMVDLLVPEPTPFLGPSAAPDGLTAAALLRVSAGGVLKFLWPVLALAMLTAAAYAGLLFGHFAPNALWLFVCTFLWLSLVGTVAAIGIVVGLLRSRERTDVPDNTIPNQTILRKAVAHEDSPGIMQSHLTGVSRMKPGWLRKLTLRVAFWLIAQLAARVYRPGYLGALGTIHSARWVRLPGTDKLIFLSNYGGSWESYLEDFITQASGGLTAVWSNTVGFPRTTFLLLNGATDGDRFKRWARRQQVPTRFWYSQYFSVTTRRIRANAAIRNGIASASTVDEAQAWLSLFGSQIRNETVVETADIQSIMGSGFGHYPQASCLLILLPKATADAQRWVQAILQKITYGDVLFSDCIHQIAFSVSGLERLGMTEEELSRFSLAFRTGMASRSRRRILSDTGPDDANHWIWGGPEHPVDGALLIYALQDDALARTVTEAQSDLRSFGGDVQHIVNTRRIEKKPNGAREREPFGFVDGVSQPIIRGLSRPSRPEDLQHIVEPGEFVLGYVDNRGFVVEAPWISATRDPHNLLPAVPSGTARTAYPQFMASAANADRAIGRNGSYLAIRQLRQDAAAFDGYLDRAEAEIAAHPAVAHLKEKEQRKQYIAAKMVGRWKDGSSLVHYPREPASTWDGSKKCTPDNSFLFGAEDALGEACPFGAHIRRSNPRESLDPGSKQQITITNRHRILRRGRFYKTDRQQAHTANADENLADGLLFICANADIERQFEFIQQTWAMAWQFHGLENEVDPILTRGGVAGKLARMTIPTAHGPIHLTGLSNFVDVIGGGYFFLPGKRMLRWLSAPAG